MKFFVSLFFISLLSCSSNNCPSLNSNAYPKNIQVNYLVNDKVKLASKGDFLNYLQNNKNVLYPFYEIQDTFSFDIKVNNIYSLIDNEYFDSLYYDVQREFGNKKNLFLKLDHSIGIYNSTSKKKLNPQITVLMSGFYNDVVVDKENIILGIEYFLNKENKYKPRDLPSYILERYTPEHMTSTML